MVILMNKGEPFVYSTFFEAAEKAQTNDVIYDCSNEYRVPDYIRISELEERIKKTSKFSNKRAELECELRLLMADSLRFENRKKERK